MGEIIDSDTKEDSANKRARDAAFAAASSTTITPTSRVGYRSRGRLLLLGELKQALDLGARLKGTGLSCWVLAQGEGVIQAQGDVPMVVIPRGVELKISGHLGEFTVTLISKEHGDINIAQALETGFTQFDLILDLNTPPLLGWEVLPLGYHAPQGNPAELARVLEELPDQVGEFEKATFFRYDPAICAHGSRGVKGCTRCLDACPTGAIASLGEKITVDPYLCQGGGSCATACPSGAITYSFPLPGDILERICILLRTYREQGGSRPILLFHDAERGSRYLAPLLDEAPGQLLPLEVEEVGSVGIELWLAAIAYGASQVLILDTPQVPVSVRHELQQQLQVAHLLLQGMGYPAEALRLVRLADDPAALPSLLQQGAPMPSIKPAGFTGTNRKRDNLSYAIDCLAAQAPQSAAVIPLPKQAPFGEIQVNGLACTLCMACVAVCPASALFDGGDAPRLEFIEANCVQCGLCEVACPEDAITRHPRFVLAPQQRRRRRILHEDAVFHCIGCGKPFATQRMIHTLTLKLADHSMYRGAAARQRLQMCGDCRVRGLFDEAKTL